MKKLIVLLGIAVVGCMVVLTQGEVKNTQKNEHGYEKNVIELQGAFERDQNVNKLLEYLASVQKQEQNNEKQENRISIDREGGIVSIYLYGIENNTYTEQVEKIERVLGLEGLTDFVYDEAFIEKESLLISGINNEYGTICRNKYYDEAIVSVSAYKSTTDEGEEYVGRCVSIEVPSEKLKNATYATLAENFVEDGYYVSTLLQGEERDVMVLVNAKSLTSTGDYTLNEEGEMISSDLTKLRYEVVVGNNQPEEVKLILESKEKIAMDETDEAVLGNIAKTMGLGEEEILDLKQTINQTVEKPSKNQSKEIGQWQYSSRYTTTQRNQYEGRICYLEISLSPLK